MNQNDFESQQNYLKQQNDALKEMNRTLYADCLRLMDLYRNSVGEVSALVVAKLNDFDTRIRTIESKLSVLCQGAGTDVQSDSRKLAEGVEAMRDKASRFVTDACEKAALSMSEAESYTEKYSQSVLGMKEKLQQEIATLKEETEQLRNKISD